MCITGPNWVKCVFTWFKWFIHQYFTNDTIGLLYKSHDASVPHPSHGAPFSKRNVHMRAHFSYKMKQCGIFVRCTGGFVRWVYLLLFGESLHQMETFSALLSLCVGNPWVTDGPLMFLCCQREQTVEQTLDWLAIRDVMTVICRRHNEPINLFW